MSGNLPVAIPIVLFIASIVALYRTPRTYAAKVGALSALAAAVLVPSFATSAPVAVVTILGTIVVLALALLRDREGLTGAKFPLLLLAFLTWSAIAGSVGSPIKLILLNVATGVLLALLALVVVVAVRRGHNLFLPFFAVVIVFEFLIGLAEEFLGWKAMWPRANGTDEISHRVNSVVPFLIGRAMGSTAQPIPYGMVLGFGVIVCLWFAVKDRSWRLFALAGFGLVAMLFSGTRSAFLAVGAAVVLWLALALRKRLVILIPLLAVTAAAVVVSFLSLLQPGNKQLLSSDSVAHRLGILETAGNLMQRNPLEILFGSGYASMSSLIETGVVHGVRGIDVFDQEFIRTLACVGAVGFFLFISSIVLGFVRGDRLTRLLIVFLSLGFLAFDGFSWRLTATLLVTVLAYGYGLTRPVTASEPELETESRPLRSRIRAFLTLRAPSHTP